MGVEIVRLGCKKLVSKKMDWRAFVIWALLLVIAQGRQINADEGGYYDSDTDRPDDTEEFPAVHQTVHQQFPGHHNHLGALGARSLKKANGGKRGNGKAKKESEACSCTDLWWNYPASNCCRDKSFMESKKKKVGCEKIKVNCKKVRYYDLSLCCPKPKVIEMNKMTHTTKNTPGHHNNLGALGVRSLKKANGGQGTGIAHDSEACSCTDLWWNYPASNCCRDKSFMESKKKKVGCEKIKVNCKKVRYYDLSLCCPKPKVIEMNEMTHTTKKHTRSPQQPRCPGSSLP